MIHVSPIVAACVSSLATMAALAHAQALPSPTPELHRYVEGCTMSIVLVGVDGSIVSRTIDKVTGGLGFSHAMFDPCREDRQGRRWLIDYSVEHGVHWSRAKRYDARRQVRVDLEPRIGGEVMGCVQQRLGRPLRVSALAMGIDSVATCVGLIVSCLPTSVQAELQGYKVGPCISPNTLAAYFGVS